MVGWIIFGSILLILILIFIQSVSVTAVLDKKPEVRIKFMWFTIVKMPADPKTLKKRKLKAERKRAKEEKKAAKAAKKAERKAAKEAEKNGVEKPPELQPEPVGEQENEPSEPAKTEPVDPKALKKAEKERRKAEKEAKKAERERKKAEKANKPHIDFEMIMDYVRSASPPVKRLFRKIRIRDLYVDWVVGSDEAGKTAIKYGGLCTAFYSLEKFLTTYFDAKIGEINIEADFRAEKDDIFIYVTLKLRICTAVGCALWLAFRVLKTYLKYNRKEPKKHGGKRSAPRNRKAA